MMLRASWCVAPMRATRCMRPSRMPSAIHSAPARVLPLPRPPMRSQMRQSPGGGSCSSRAQKCQSAARYSHSASLRCSHSAAVELRDTDAIDLALKFRADISIFLESLACTLRDAFALGARKFFERAFQRRERARIGGAARGVGARRARVLDLLHLAIEFVEQSAYHVVQPV